MTIEATKLRRRHDDLVEETDRRPRGVSTGCACMLVKTATKTTYPTTAGAFYYCQAEGVLGAESEGSAGTTSGDTGSFLYALNLGTQIPPAGTLVVVSFVASRWVFRYDG